MAATAADSGSTSGAKPMLRRLGFCGADDSCDPDILAAISAVCPVVEWGVLLRPDLEGEPRYATPAWVERLAAAKKRVGGRMHLAGHLCGERVPQVLAGDASYVKALAGMGFGRVQVNATSANGVDTSRLAESAEGLRTSILAVPEVEWIIQRNEETQPLWEALGRLGMPENSSFLYDASCGKGVLSLTFATPPGKPAVGYAGGMGPDNIVTVLEGVGAAAGTTPVWVDMESSLRGKRDGRDIFSVARCLSCLANAAGRYDHAAVPEDLAPAAAPAVVDPFWGAASVASKSTPAGCCGKNKEKACSKGGCAKSCGGSKKSCGTACCGRAVALVCLGALAGYAIAKWR